MTNQPDPIEAAIEAAILQVATDFSHGNRDDGMFVAFVASDGYTSIRGASAVEVATVAIRAAAPILIQHGRELAAQALIDAAQAATKGDVEYYEFYAPEAARTARGDES